MEPAQLEAETSRPSVKLVWSSTASTKFRAPKLRHDAIQRTALLQRARSLALEKRVTLVRAPAGSGKSTLMAQLAADCAPAAMVWLSLDDDDSDANRLFVSMLTALRAVELEWQVDPQVLASQVLGAGQQSRAAVSLLVNALCSYQGDRLLIALDDLHRVTDANALQLLNQLIEHLPPEVGMLIGTRVSPNLSLSRWRSRRELGELLMADLQFDEPDAQALALARLADGATPQLVRHALKRTQGWVTGLQLLFGADPQAQPSSRGRANRHTFDFLAHEVIGDLPHELRDFAMRCSVLPELSPDLCNAVTQGSSAQQLLDDLYRRDLFLTVLDEVTPVLRFHDLFREFLQRELERQVSPEEVRNLHAIAAQAETVPTRAVAHWLKAARWDVAVAAIERCAEPLLAEGGHALVERWIRQLPPEQQLERAEVVRLLAMCASSTYANGNGRVFLERACELYRKRGDQVGLAQTLPILARACNFVGDLEACNRFVSECETLDLDSRAKAALSVVRAWDALANGRCEDVTRALDDLISIAQADLGALYPAVADLFNSLFYGIPGALARMRKLKELCLRLEQRGPVHWQVSALAHSGWPEFWQGDYSAATAALEDQEQSRQRRSAVPALWLDMGQLRSVHLTVSGRFTEALALVHANLELIRSSELKELRSTWLRPVYVECARFACLAHDVESLGKVLVALSAPRAPTEWPVLGMGRALARGRCALLERRLDEAVLELTEACRLHERWRLLAFMGDPRTALAMVHLEQRNQRAAWLAFEPVWREAIDDDALGTLLYEPQQQLAELLALMPTEWSRHPSTQILLKRLATWKQAPVQARARANQRASALAQLTQRECEVLARIAAGDSNKLIARELDLSPHTAKRHVANILSKLNVPTRNAAAALYRQQHS